MGHLTRLLAYGRRVGVRTSCGRKQAVGVVRAVRVPVRVRPVDGRDRTVVQTLGTCSTNACPMLWHGCIPRSWSSTGTWPVDGLGRVRDMYSDVRCSLVPARYVAPRKERRADREGCVVPRSTAPGELAEPATRGRPRLPAGTRLGPVTLLDADELEDRDAARQALGLPLDRRLA